MGVGKQGGRALGYPYQLAREGLFSAVFWVSQMLQAVTRQKEMGSGTFSCVPSHSVQSKSKDASSLWEKGRSLLIWVDTASSLGPYSHDLVIHSFFSPSFKTGSHCVFSGCPGTHYVYYAGFELTGILLPLPPKCWN